MRQRKKSLTFSRNPTGHDQQNNVKKKALTPVPESPESECRLPVGDNGGLVSGATGAPLI